MFRLGISAKRQRETQEHEKMARLERAEGDIESLRTRAAQVIRRLDDRQRRNHWREAIEQMIQGVT